MDVFTSRGQKDLILKQRGGHTAVRAPSTEERLFYILLSQATKGKRKKIKHLPLQVSLSALSLPDHILRLHLHCPLQYPSLLYQQLETRCLPSGLLPIFCVLAVLALPVSFYKTE